MGKKQTSSVLVFKKTIPKSMAAMASRLCASNSKGLGGIPLHHGFVAAWPWKSGLERKKKSTTFLRKIGDEE